MSVSKPIHPSPTAPLIIVIFNNKDLGACNGGIGVPRGDSSQRVLVLAFLSNRIESHRSPSGIPCRQTPSFLSSLTGPPSSPSSPLSPIITHHHQPYKLTSYGCKITCTVLLTTLLSTLYTVVDIRDLYGLLRRSTIRFNAFHLHLPPALLSTLYEVLLPLACLFACLWPSLPPPVSPSLPSTHPTIVSDSTKYKAILTYLCIQTQYEVYIPFTSLAQQLAPLFHKGTKV